MNIYINEEYHNKIIILENQKNIKNQKRWKDKEKIQKKIVQRLISPCNAKGYERGKYGECR